MKLTQKIWNSVNKVNLKKGYNNHYLTLTFFLTLWVLFSRNFVFFHVKFIREIWCFFPKIFRLKTENGIFLVVALILSRTLLILPLSAWTLLVLTYSWWNLCGTIKTKAEPITARCCLDMAMEAAARPSWWLTDFSGFRIRTASPSQFLSPHTVLSPETVT